MVISKLSQGFELQDKMSTIHLNPTGKDLNDSLAFIINTRLGDSKYKTVFDLPGLFEAKDITVANYSIGVNVVNAVKIVIEGVKVLYLESSIASIPNYLLEDIGEVNIVILDLLGSEGFQKIIEITRKLEPKYIVLSGDVGLINDFCTTFGDIAEETKKVKVKEDEFGEEVSKITLMKLV